MMFIAGVPVNCYFVTDFVTVSKSNPNANPDSFRIATWKNTSIEVERVNTIQADLFCLDVGMITAVPSVHCMP